MSDPLLPSGWPPRALCGKCGRRIVFRELRGKVSREAGNTGMYPLGAISFCPVDGVGWPLTGPGRERTDGL